MNLVPCHSAIHYCKIHLFPFSFGSVNRAFPTWSWPCLCVCWTPPRLSPKVSSLLRSTWRFLCGRPVSPPLWTPETNWWPSSKTNWRMTHRGETAHVSVHCLLNKHIHTDTLRSTYINTCWHSNLLISVLVVDTRVDLLPGNSFDTSAHKMSDT